MRTIYAVIDDTGTHIFTKRRGVWSAMFVAAQETQKIKTPAFTNVVLITNSLKTAVRTSAASVSKKQQKPDWNVVKSVFPIGDKMNEHTHIFDGKLFVNQNETPMACFFMAAIPVYVADSITNTAVSLFGNIHKIERIDTIEHLLFQYYVSQGKTPSEPFAVVFLQGDGLRILHVANNLPQSAKIISNHAEFRVSEFLRVWNSFKEDAETMPQRVVVLKMHDGNELDWLHDFFDENKIAVEEEIFDFANFIPS